MSEKTLKFGDIVVNKKEFQEEFHTSKQAIDLNSVKTGKILVSYKFKHSDDGFKYFIGYLHYGDVIRLLCIVLTQISDNGEKNISLKNEEDENVYLKYTEIWK